MKAVRLIMLTGVSHLCSEEDDHPAHLNPSEKQRERRKTAVDGTVTRHPYLKLDVDPLDDLSDGSPGDAAQNSRPDGNWGIRHDQVERPMNRLIE